MDCSAEPYRCPRRREQSYRHLASSTVSYWSEGLLTRARLLVLRLGFAGDVVVGPKGGVGSAADNFELTGRVSRD